MSEEKLRNCPFCGGEAQYDEDCFGTWTQKVYDDFGKVRDKE